MNKLPFINDTIKSQKQKLKLNQTEFANLIGKSLSTVKKYDIGYPIPEETLIKICDVLKIDFLPLLYYQSLSQNESYQNLILKYSNKIKDFENKNNESELFKVAEELKKLYKNFYDKNYNNDTNIIKIDGTKKELNYKIIDNRIFIIETSIPLLRQNEDIKNQEINNFTLEEGKTFITEFKEYFNFKNDMHKKRKSSITLKDILESNYK